jgi:hypothetical protein
MANRDMTNQQFSFEKHRKSLNAHLYFGSTGAVTLDAQGSKGVLSVAKVATPAINGTYTLLFGWAQGTTNYNETYVKSLVIDNAPEIEYTGATNPAATATLGHPAGRHQQQHPALRRPGGRHRRLCRERRRRIVRRRPGLQVAGRPGRRLRQRGAARDPARAGGERHAGREPARHHQLDRAGRRSELQRVPHARGGRVRLRVRVRRQHVRHHPQRPGHRRRRGVPGRRRDARRGRQEDPEQRTCPRTTSRGLRSATARSPSSS